MTIADQDTQTQALIDKIAGTKCHPSWATCTGYHHLAQVLRVKWCQHWAHNYKTTWTLDEVGLREHAAHMETCSGTRHVAVEEAQAKGLDLLEAYFAGCEWWGDWSKMQDAMFAALEDDTPLILAILRAVAVVVGVEA